MMLFFQINCNRTQTSRYKSINACFLFKIEGVREFNACSLSLTRQNNINYKMQNVTTPQYSSKLLPAFGATQISIIIQHIFVVSLTRWFIETMLHCNSLHTSHQLYITFYQIHYYHSLQYSFLLKKGRIYFSQNVVNDIQLLQLAC